MAVDYFLKIDGIPGESVDKTHKGEIEVDSWSWGESNPVPGGGATGGATGKVHAQDLLVTSRFSKASPALLLACAAGKHFKSAVLSARATGAPDFLTFSLSDVLVSSYQTGASEADAAPVDSVSLNFSKLEVEYKEQGAGGKLGGPTKAGWDFKLNKQL